MKDTDFLKQVESDNRFCVRIEKAVAKKDKRELARLDKEWAREEQKERNRFARETRKDY